MKITDIHVAVFPIGSIVKFSKEKLKRSDGSNEYYKMIWSLVRQKHIRKVTIVQKSRIRPTWRYFRCILGIEFTNTTRCDRSDTKREVLLSLGRDEYIR